RHYMNPNQANEGSTTDAVSETRLRELDDAILALLSEPTLAVKSLSALPDSAILQMLSFEQATIQKVLDARFKLLLYLVQSNQRTQTSGMSETSGRETQKRSDC